MNRDDTARTLLNSLSALTSRDWGSPEKNNGAVELTRRIREVVTLRDDIAMGRLVEEVKYFTPPTFTLFERMKRLVEHESEKKWGKPVDDATWGKFIERAKIVIDRRDGAEIIEIAQRIIVFLRQRNGHVLAGKLEDAVKLTKKPR